MTFDGIRVTHATLTRTSTDLSVAARQIRTRLDQLEGELAPLSTGWSGEAQRSYQQARTAWGTAINEMMALLDEMSAAVTESNEAYRQADRRGAARFA